MPTIEDEDDVRLTTLSVNNGEDEPLIFMDGPPVKEEEKAPDGARKATLLLTAAGSVKPNAWAGLTNLSAQ